MRIIWFAEETNEAINVLGIIVNNNLNFETHMDMLCKKIFSVFFLNWKDYQQIATQVLF